MIPTPCSSKDRALTRPTVIARIVATSQPRHARARPGHLRPSARTRREIPGSRQHGALRVAALSISLVFAAPAVASIYEAVTAPTDDFSRPEAYERNPGGATTSDRIAGRNVFRQMAPNLPFSARIDFSLGEAIFQRLWTAAPASTQATDGLGPLFNARACDRCHILNGRGHTPNASLPEDSAVSLLARISVAPRNEADTAALESGRFSAIPHPNYGTQIQDLAVPGHTAEARLEITWHDRPVTLADGTFVTLRRPDHMLADPAYGPLGSDLQISVRIAPQMIGLGLLELIDEAEILARADPDDSDNDGISGRPNIVWDDAANALALGRFGWKAGQPSIAQQNAAAFTGDMGLSSPLYPAGAGECTAVQTACLAAPDGNSPQFENVEVPGSLMDPLLFYTRHLAVPARRDIAEPNVLRGKDLFYASGCAGCHTPKYVTVTDANLPALSHQLIWPYTDLLLHDMGEGLADGRPEFRADGREWRTPPLWGIGLIEQVNGAAYYLHDGRARSLAEAILWHGGEAEPAREAFAAMRADDRAAMIAFLNTL